MKKILPLRTSPIQCYPDYGGFFGIIDVYTKNYLDWIYNFFFQLVVTDNNSFRLDFAAPRILKALPWLDVEKISRSIVEEICDSITDFIEVAINNNKYIYALFDTFYTYSKDSERHHLHEHLIYGYDGDLQELYFCDNFIYGKYSKGKISYEELIKANKSVIENKLIDWYDGIMMLSYVQLYDYGN